MLRARVLPLTLMAPPELIVPVPAESVCAPTVPVMGFGPGANCAKAGLMVMRRVAAMRPARMRGRFMGGWAVGSAAEFRAITVSRVLTEVPTEPPKCRQRHYGYILAANL